jgi:D-sedoheptulose 7-phosphate isomerase
LPGAALIGTFVFLLKVLVLASMTYQDIISQELREAQTVLDTFLSDPVQIEKIEKAASLMADAILNNHKIISCGNGGSHCDAMHFAEELTGRYRDNRRSLPAIAISDVSHISCVSNDFGFEYVFSRFIEGLGQEGDVLLGLSTSGNSANIIRAVEAAKEKGMKVVIMSGKDGGKLAGMADVEIRVPHFGYADRIQEIHIKVIHIFMLLIEKMVIEK